MPDVILASASRTRGAMLENAGVPFTALPPGVDEDAVKASLKGEGATAAEAAEALAEIKATRLSQRHHGALVIGADQMLVCDDRWYDKPADRLAARGQLLELRGKTHHLVTASVVMLGGQRIWHHVETAKLTMRPFSEEFLEQYLDKAGDAVLSSVGAYQLEAAGAQLFSRVEGNHFVILGLPLLPLLDFLRVHGVLAS
ncbi:MAG TPA: Maf family protein [Candidatus Sulfotelmatobacter sp.]|jgi:septum formation protein|nr:Maf family protein [Candidatus Sulfotelmatobacter sp.]